MLSNLTSHMGFAKMIYDRFCALFLSLCLLPFLLVPLSREHLHHPGALGMYPLIQGRFRSEWVTTTRGTRRCMYVGVLYNRVRRNARIYYALHREETWAESGRDAFRICASLSLPVDFSSVINFQTTSTVITVVLYNCAKCSSLFANLFNSRNNL